VVLIEDIWNGPKLAGASVFLRYWVVVGRI